jgi:signal transduction histidine kinase/ActR/RegA family two-component response regulator
VTGVDFKRLLRLAGELQRATDFDALLRAVQQDVREVTGYTHAWLIVLEPDKSHARPLAFLGPSEQLGWEHAPRIPVAGDQMMEEIVRGQETVVVVDARTDPRTNKEIVAKLGNRTIINVPLALIDSPLGALGTGTFADEGPRAPTEAELDYLAALSTQVSVAVARIRWLEEREALARERTALERRILLAQKMESIGLLAGGVAHDLNNLLMIVMVHASLLGEGSLSEEQRADVAALTGAAQRAAVLTHQLLDASRPRPGRLARVDLHYCLGRLAALLRSSVPATITVEILEGATRPTCLGNAAQLDQVFMNLAVNARDAMPGGGRLRLETSEVELSGRYLEPYPWTKPGSYVVVTVIDDGCGMSAPVLERVFEPFFTTKAPGEGTGLGLAVAYGVVRQHGGFVHAKSEIGVGTTMRVYLPVYQAELQTDRPRIDDPVSLGSERILVAEDDAAVRAGVVHVLEGAGYRVVTATNGAEAVAAVARDPFDLVVLDLLMPKLDGQHAYAHIRDLRPRTPCLFSTGRASRLPPDLAAGSAVEVLHKPYEPDDLLRAVRRTLDLGLRPSRAQ